MIGNAGRDCERPNSALLGAFEFDNGRAWKGYDFDVMDRLHAEGMISDPRNRNQSVHLTPEGLARAKALADAWFGASTTH